MPDQDALNLAVMAYAEQVSLMGPQAMALGPGRSVMSHAIGGPKPWRKRFLLSALGGNPPRLADWDWVRHSDGPSRSPARPVGAGRWSRSTSAAPLRPCCPAGASPRAALAVLAG